MPKSLSADEIVNAWKNILEEKNLHSNLFINKIICEHRFEEVDQIQLFNEHGYFLDVDKKYLEGILYTTKMKEMLDDVLDKVIKTKLDEAIEKGTDCKFSVWDRADGEYTTEEEQGEIIKVSDKIILLSNFFGFVGEIYTHKAKTNKLKTVYEIQNLNPIHYNYGLDINFKGWKFAHIIDNYSIINDEITSHYSWPPQILSINF